MQIGSDVVEGGWKSLFGRRLNQSSMRWTKDGADAILALRCCVLSGHYEDFWESRSDPAQLRPSDASNLAHRVPAS